MKPVIVIEKLADLVHLVEALTGHEFIAIDTESNSFYAYFEKVCLIQISTLEEDYVIDPFSVGDLSPLKDILKNQGVEKIFHASSNDVLGLKRDFGFEFQNVFDTAVSCKLLGYKHLGLAKIIDQHFGVSLNKKKWQRCDWGKRPLTREQLDYARFDTHFLIPLRHMLAENLIAKDLIDAAKEAFERACQQAFQGKSFHPDAFIQIKGARLLDDLGKKVLKALYRYREEQARHRNRAPFRIISNEALIRIAQQRPKDIKEIAAIKGIPRSYHHNRGAQRLLSLIRKCQGNEDEALQQ